MLGIKMPGRDCRREPGKFRNFAMVDIGAVENGEGDDCNFFYEPSDSEGWQRFDEPNEPFGSRDLTRPQWRDPAPSPDEERELIRLAQAGDRNAKDKLLRCFHRLALKIAKEFYGPPHNDLVEAAILGFFEGVKRYELGRNDCPRLGSYAAYYIREEVRKEVWRWRKGGDSSQTRVDRWVHDHPSATPDEVVAAAGSALKLKRVLSPGKAQAAIDRADACRNGHDSIDKIDSAFDEAGNHLGPKFGTSHRLHSTGHELFDECDQLNPYHLSPQLAPAASGDADELLRSALDVDELPKDVEQQLQIALTEDDDKQAKERLKDIRKRLAEDVERRAGQQKPRIVADPNLYRTKKSLRDRVRIAARSHEPLKLLGPRRFDGKEWVRSQPAVAGLEQFRQAQPRKRPHWTFQEGSQRSLGNTPVMDVAGWGPKKKASEVRARLEPSHRIHKQAAREQINKLVPEYLSSGGEIAQCPRDPKLDDSRKPTLAEFQRYQQVLDRYCNQDRAVSCEPPQSRQPEKEKVSEDDQRQEDNGVCCTGGACFGGSSRGSQGNVHVELHLPASPY